MLNHLLDFHDFLQWNSHGYDVAKTFAPKLDIISPVWFQVVKQGSNYVVQGKHDIDSRWVKTVREKSKSGASRATECKY